MDEFLKGTEAFSFEALVDAAFNDGEAASSRPAKLKQKSTKKEKKKAKEKVEEQSKAVKDEDFADEELTPAQADPYLCEADLEVEGNEEVKMSKRALHRALYGFNRRSGGKKHKPKAKAKSIGKRPVAGAVGGKNTLLFVVVHSCLLLFLLCTAQSGKCFLKFKPFTL